MNGKSKILEIDKYVTGRLWYTAWIILRKEIDTLFENYTEDEILQLKCLIQLDTCSQNNIEDHWIVWKLLNLLNVKSFIIKANHIEFVSALKFMRPTIAENVENELLTLFHNVSNSKNVRENVDKLSSETLTFLKECLEESPSLACYFIKTLLCIWSPLFHRSDEELQNLCVGCLKKIVSIFDSDDNTLPDDESARQNSPFTVDKPKLSQKSLGILLSILTSVELADSNREKLLDWLYPALFNCCCNSDIELALYARRNNEYLNDWYTYQDRMLGRHEIPTTVDKAITIGKAIFTLGENSKVSINSKELISRTINNKTHWILELLDICGILVLAGHEAKVETLLSVPVVKKIWPAVLFRVFANVSDGSNTAEWNVSLNNCHGLRFILNKCQTLISCDATWKEVDVTLRNHFDVVEWIVAKNKLSPTKECVSESRRELSVKYVLSLLRTDDVLSVLNATSNVHTGDPDEIRYLLRHSPESTNVFNAYTAMLNLLKAIPDSNSDHTDFHKVRNYLTEMNSILKNLTPLSLRLETTENIFSMLFLRHEDFCSNDVYSEESQDESDETCGVKKIVAEDNKGNRYGRSGFICNKFIVRDLLHFLEIAIADMKIEFERTKREAETITCVEDIEKGIFELSEAIVDAKWRLELLTSSQFLNQVGIGTFESSDNKIDRKQASMIFTKKQKLSKSLPHKSSLYHQDDSSSDQDSCKSEVTVSSDAGFTETGIANSVNRRKQAKKGYHEKSMKNSSNYSFIVNSMLSSRDSLIIECLWNGDFDKAQRVIEMFSPNESYLDAEVRFSKAINEIRRKIHENPEAPAFKESNEKPENMSTLQSIRQVVEEGIQTSRLKSQLETFLASNKSTARMLKVEENNANEILTMAILDVALTTGHSRTTSIITSEVAKKYLKSLKSIDKPSYAAYFAKICQLFYESKVEASLPTVTCDVSIPMSSEEFNEQLRFFKELETILELINESRTVKENTCNKLTRKKFLIHADNFEKILTHSHGVPYLSRVFTHLKILETMLPDEIDKSTDGSSPCSLLESPIQFYFGRQFFELGVEPELLEPIANKLQVNLVHSILINCCPKFPYRQVDEKSVTILRTNKPSCCVVLNDNSSTDVLPESMSEKPNDYITQILDELLRRIGSIYPNKSILRRKELENLSGNTEIRSILLKTCSIAHLSLCELAAGNETLAFFLNLWNLMFLHSSLIVWSDEAPQNRLQQTVSPMTIGYRVGELGLITLATLRSKLLGDLAWDLDFYKQLGELNEYAWQDLDLAQDPRVIYAMANEFYGTPVIRAYDSRSLDDELNTATRAYINHYHVIDSQGSDRSDRKADTCWLPELVRRYQDFVLQNSSLMNQTFGSSLNEGFVTMREFLNLNENNVEFKYKPQSYRYELRLGYAGHKCFTPNSLDVVDRPGRNMTTTPTYGNKILEPVTLQYFEGHCWLISYLVQKIYKQTSTSLSDSIGDEWRRCACLENLLQSEWADKLKVISHKNRALAAMHENLTSRELWSWLESFAKKGQWDTCLDVMNALADNLFVKNRELRYLKDLVLSHLISPRTNDPARTLCYIYQIRDIRILAHSILSNVKYWPVDLCRKALTYILGRSAKNELPATCLRRIDETLCRVTAFHKMLPHFANDPEIRRITWYAIAYGTNRTDAQRIVKFLIDANKFHLCLEWPKNHMLSIEMQSLVTEDMLVGLLETDRRDFEPANKLLQTLPIGQSMKLCDAVLKKLESLEALTFVTSFLIDHCKSSEIVKYQKILLAIQILTCFDSKERSSLIHLLREPFLMLEQLLMNGKFEILQKILNTMTESLSKCNITREEIDKVVRYYAGKSLDFRVALQRDTIDTKSKEFGSSNSESDSMEFTMPLKVPTKDEWVPNDKARICSCCKSVVFSMFNRRHHCRRCGRVVCAVCSQQRMRVPTYPDSVHVRICDDCKRLSALRTQQQFEAPSTPSSETFDYWRLTTDPSHNKTVKDEFSYEHAPSISLGLAILNLHSDHEAYARFLLDRCKEMTKLLRPVSSGRINPEIDHTLLIKMIRSLLVAAKVKCAKLSLNADLNHCDRLLSYVDLVTTLIQSDCSALVPWEDLNEHTLRKLRDLLTEKEQWILALDVSTKSGLDRQGVWAACGKAYLRVDCFEQAREKFAHCLEKVSSDSHGDWIFVSRSTKQTGRPIGVLGNETKAAEGPKIREKMRPAKNPPLLTEILQILQSSPSNRQIRRSNNARSTNAHDISARLNNIKAISQGRHNEPESLSKVGNANYNECLYYLVSYGSNAAILTFFIKHQKFDESLAYVLENDVDPDLFFNNIYLLCLKNGHVDKLHESMKSKDSTLIVWKNYLVYTCHSLETRKFLNTLYHLQIFMRDYVRASMSCIRFYTTEATDYTDLCARSTFLTDAQKHLETELHVQNFGQTRRKSLTSSHSSGHGSLTLELELSDIDKHINTISRQMEIAKFLWNAEQEGRNVRNLMKELSKLESDTSKTQELPTLFGTQVQKTQLAILAILCGRDVEEGFGIAFRIIQDYNLRSEKVYSLAGHILASEGKIHSIEQLVKCCRSSGAPDTNALSDRVLAHCTKIFLNSSQIDQSSGARNKVDSLIKLITDIELKISMCIESRQLKSAYLLAVRHSRIQDVKRILKEADRLEQNAIKVICAKWLQQAQRSQDRT